MLKELFEGHFYATFPKVQNRVLNLTEYVRNGTFSLLDPKACRDCQFICDSNPANREQMKVDSQQPVNIISIDEVFSYVKENLGETCDYMLESNGTIAVVEMTCSTTDYAMEKRQKARRQLYNTLTHLMTSPIIKDHIERLFSHYVVFSWKETFDSNVTGDSVGESMTGMTVMADEVYSPDNESKFDFGFKMKEIRYPYALVI